MPAESSTPLRYLSPIHRASRQIGSHLEGPLAERTLSTAEGHLITYLGSYAPCAVGDLLAVFGHPPSTLTSILDRLDRKGMIERVVNPDDRRSFLISLTGKGRRQAKAIRKLIEELEARIGRRVAKRDLEGFRAVMSVIEEETKPR